MADPIEEGWTEEPVEQPAEGWTEEPVDAAPADGFGELTPLPTVTNQPDQFDKMMPGGFETDLVSPTATRFASTYVQAPQDFSDMPKTKDAVERENRISGLSRVLGAIGDYAKEVKEALALNKALESNIEEARRSWLPEEEQARLRALDEAAARLSAFSALGGSALPLEKMATFNDVKMGLQLDNAEAARIRGEGAFAIAAQRNLEAQRQLQAAELSFQEAMAAVEGRLVPDITAQREELEAQLPLDLREEGVAGVLADITSGSESTLQAAAEGAKVAGPGVAIGLVAGAVTKNPALARTVVMNSAKFGGLAGAANFTFRQEAGSTFKETADWKGSDGKPLSLQERAGAAIVTGLVNTGIEIGSDLIALYKLEPALVAVAGGESSLRAQVARDPRLRAMLVRAAKTWVQASTPEVLEEGAQAVTGQAVHAAVSQDLSVFSPSEAVDAMGQSIVPMFLGVGVVGPVLHVAAESSLRHEYQKAGQRVTPLLKLAADADMQASPAEFVAVAEKVGAGPVYVRGEAVKRFFQERSEDVGEQQRQLEEALGPGAVEKVETAAATGGSVEVSLEALPQWAKHEASGALVDDSSTHPEAPTPRELRSGGAAVEEAAQKLASEELAKHADGMAFEKVVDRWTVEQVAAGQPKGQAKVAAMVLRHLVATAAKDSGKSPMEIARSAEFHFLPGDEQPMPAKAPTAPDIETFLTNRLQSQDPMTEAGKAALVKDFFIDAATGVRNRRFWDLEKKTAVTVGAISIEGVKFQNDKFGHQAGDALYAAAAQALAQSGIDNGTLSRPGGDFTIANVTQEQLDAALERANLNPVLRGYRLSGHVAQTHEQTPEKDLTRVAAEKHNAAKKALEDAGQRAPRGAKPMGAVDEAQMQARPVEGSVVSEARTADLLALDQEQQFQQQYTEPTTGLLTKDARDRYLEAHPKKHHVTADLNLLKAYNTLIGEVGGDTFIEEFGKLITELGGREFLATHVSGDEYTFDTDDLEGVQDFLEDLRNTADSKLVKVKHKDGSTAVIPGFTFGVGVGPTIDLAEEQLNADKERLAAAGKRGRDFEGSLAIARENLARGADRQARADRGSGSFGPTGGAVSGEAAIGNAGAEQAINADRSTDQGAAGSSAGAGQAREVAEARALIGEGPALDEFDRLIAERSARAPLRAEEARLLAGGLNNADNVRVARALVAARPEGDWKQAATARLDWVENLSTARTRIADGRSVVVPDAVWTEVDAWLRDPVRNLADPEFGASELQWRHEHPGQTPPWLSSKRDVGGFSKGMQTSADAQVDKRRYQTGQRNIYFRIQPKGLGIAGHLSESSDGSKENLHVFTEPWQVLATDVSPKTYGDEVVVISGGEYVDNGDVEGVGIDPSGASIVARFSYSEWVAKIAQTIGMKDKNGGSIPSDIKSAIRWLKKNGFNYRDVAKAVDAPSSALDELAASFLPSKGIGRLAQVATEEDKATTPNQKIIARVEEILREKILVNGVGGVIPDEVRFTRKIATPTPAPIFNIGDSVVREFIFQGASRKQSGRITRVNKSTVNVRLLSDTYTTHGVHSVLLAQPKSAWEKVNGPRRETLDGPVVELLSWPNRDSYGDFKKAEVKRVSISQIIDSMPSHEKLANDVLLYIQAVQNESTISNPPEATPLVSVASAVEGDWLQNGAGVWEQITSVDRGPYETTFHTTGGTETFGSGQEAPLIRNDTASRHKKQVHLTPRWYQDETPDETPKGYFDGAEQVATGQVLRVFLNKSADISTTLHEVSHAWLEFYKHLAAQPDATTAVQTKFADIMAWLGVEEGAAITKDQHEKFARTFEQYLLEGKAPKPGLSKVFNTIKRWMLGIYRSARGVPGAELNEQSRRVFDALLATQDEVEAYQRAQGLADQKKPATVTAEEWQAQLEAQRDAVSEGSRKAELRAVKDALRVHERWWKDGVRKLKKVFADEYQQLPGVRAARFLKDAKLRLDPFDLPDNAGQIADTLGFASIDDLVRALAEIPDEQKWVEEHAEEEMRQQHPGILERRDDMRASVADGLNAYTEKRLLDERANLRKHDPRIGAAPIAMLRRAAELIVARTTLAKLNAGLALAREAKAAKEAYEAAAKGKWADAAKANQQQLLNHFLYRELMAARDLRTNLEDTASKASKKAARERLGKASEHYRNAVDFILGKLALAPPVEGLDAGALQQVAGQLQGDAMVVGDPEWLPDLIEATRADSYKDLTVAQGLAVLDALTQIQHAARARTEAVIEGQKLEEAEVLAHLIDEAKTNKQQQAELPSTESAATLAQRLSTIPDRLAPLLKIETMVDWLGGALVGKDPQASWWYRSVFKPLEGARQRESDLFKSRIQPIDAAMNTIPGSVRKTWMDPIDGRKLFPGHKAGDLAPPSRRFELLVMALNAGTPSSLERLTRGRNITLDQVQSALGLLTKEEIDWVNSVGEAFDGMWPEIAAMEERVTGLRPQALERRAMELRNGRLEGHYFPAIYDKRASVAGARQASQEEVASLFEGGFGGFGTRHGHTKARVEGFYAPIALEPGAILTHLAQAVHDLAFREPVMQVGRRILDPSVQAALTSALGVKRKEQFRLWAQDAAIGSVQASQHAGDLLRLARKLKANTTIAALGYSVPNFFEDMSAIPSALFDRELEAGSLLAGLKTFLANPVQALDEVRRVSPVMRAADDSLQRDLTQKIGELTATGPYARGPLKWIREHAFGLIEASYNATATPMWIGMYQQAVEKGDNHAQAVDRADRLVRRLFPQHNVVNAAGIVRDRGGLGFMLQFYGFQSTALNMVASNFQEFYESKSARQRMRVAGRTLGYFLSISLIGAFLRGRGPDRDEDVSTWALRTTLSSVLNLFPFGGDLSNVLDAWMRGAQPSSRPSSALTATIDAVGRTMVTVFSDKETDKKIEEAVRAAGPLLGLPTSQAVRTGKYVSDVIAGDRTPEGVGAGVSGLIYGETDRGQWTPFNALGRLTE